jgi:hypothetical protein
VTCSAYYYCNAVVALAFDSLETNDGTISLWNDLTFFYLQLSFCLVNKWVIKTELEGENELGHDA